MGWSNEKYYSKIVNGYYDYNKNKKYSRPTIDYIFGGINHAMTYHKEWLDKKDKIYKLIKIYFLNWINYN